MLTAMIKLKRAYDPPGEEDGERILVDRLWPRGVKRESARISSWIKELGPTTELRRWFGHEPKRWREFRKRYEQELLRPEVHGILPDLARKSRSGVVTLVFAARDRTRNNAVVLKDLVDRIAG